MPFDAGAADSVPADKRRSDLCLLVRVCREFCTTSVLPNCCSYCPIWSLTSFVGRAKTFLAAKTGVGRVGLEPTTNGL